MDKTLTYLGWIALAVALVLVLTGCATTSGNLCSLGAFTADPGAAERLTRGEKEYLVALNNSGESVCGWKAIN